MALAKTILQLDAAETSEKEELYANIVNLLLENAEESYDNINNGSVKKLYKNILDDLKNDKDKPQLIKLFHILSQSKSLQRYFSDTDKEEFFKDVIAAIDSTQHENALVNYFSFFIQLPSFPNIEDSVLNDLLLRIDDVLSNKKEPASTFIACNYFQKFLKDYEERLSNFIPVLSKIVFLPLCHPSNKVREVAEKSLDLFPKILLYSSDDTSTSCLLKLLKESYCKEMLQLFKEKQEIYVLKVWTHVVKALGSAVSSNLSNITPFFQVIEKGFKSLNDEICIASFIAWKSLIDSFSGTEGFFTESHNIIRGLPDNIVRRNSEWNPSRTSALNDSKRLRFMLKPFKNISRLNENILSVACDTWMHLAWNLAEHLSDRFSEVCIPLLELTVGKISNGLSEKMPQKGGSTLLVKKSCYILLRFLELPPNEAFNRLSSPKRLPHIPYPTLQIPLDIKIITHHFKEILCVLKIIIDTCGTSEDMRPYLDCLMKSVLFIVSTIIEDSNKESTEAVNHFINFLSDVIDTKTYPSQACLKCLESLSKMPRKVLLSHNFNCGTRKPQDILCNTLLKMLLSPHLFPNEQQPKRFFATYNRLIQAGIHESFHPLTNAHKFMYVIRSAVGTIADDDPDILIELWSGVASTLLEVIEKTQEVNQGDKQEHDFSCMYDVLLFPFEFIFPVYITQFRMRAVNKLWTSLYKAFTCSANLVSTTSVNEACENFCAKLKNSLKDDVLKKPHFMESFCFFIQSIMESIDFVSGSTSGAQGILDVANMMKRKKPLGNLTSFVDLLVTLLKAYQIHYVEVEEDSLQSSAPAVQRKVHIVKNAAPLDILKAFFGNIKSGCVISLILEQLVDPLAKLFVKSSQKKNLMSQSDAKLEMLWNVITSSIERYYIGPYDSEFLTLMNPLLEATFSHPKRNIKEKSRRFWFATFGPNVSSLKFPDSLKNLLKKMKLPLLPDDISPNEFSISPMPDSLPEDSCEINPTPVPLALTKPFKSPVGVNGEVSKVAPKENKQSPKISIDDLPSEEFVKIDSPIVTTPRQRNVRKRRSYVPTLYNDLSQDTATLMSSSESQDTTNSASLEEIALKEPVVETSPKISSDKDLLNTPSTSHKDQVTISINAKSPIASKFQEKVDECLNKGQSLSIEENNSASLEVISEAKIKIPDKLTIEIIDPSSKENKTKSLICGKISVFSKPGEKQILSRNTRRTRLSQSFSILSAERNSEKVESQKLNKSCVEVVLSDSDDIIPSSQGSSETESAIKLSANNGHQKSSLTDDHSAAITEKTPEKCLSPKKDIVNDEHEDLVTENINIITSTPSKSKLPSLKIVDDVCEISNKNNELDDSLLIGNFNVKNDVTKKSSNKVNETHKVVDSENASQSKQSGIQVNSIEIDSDKGTLPDTVDILVKTTSEKSDTVTASHHLKSDVEMIGISESNIKTKDLCSSMVDEKSDSQNEIKSHVSLHQSPISSNITNMSVLENKIIITPADLDLEKIPSPYEPIAKRSRLSLKASEKNSQKDSYSQKLRKKNVDAESKPQQKPRRKKTLKKDDILSKTVKNKKDVHQISPSMHSKNIESNKIPNSVENQVIDKKEQNYLQSEKFKDFENNELKAKCSNANEENVDIPSQASDKSIETSSQNMENSDSCEIFEVCSSNSVDFQDIDKKVAQEDSQNSNSSQSDKDISDDIESQESQSSKQNETIHISRSNINGANIDGISTIPCSLENVSDSYLSKNLEVTNSKTEQSGVKLPITQCETVESKIDAKNDEISSSPSSVRFSVIEDNLSSEMHHIVDSVIGVNSKNYTNVDLSESQSVSAQNIGDIQNSPVSVIGSDKANVIYDNKTDSSICKENDKHNVELSPTKVMQNELSSHSKENVSNLIEDYNSCDVIMSSNENSENSVQIVEDSVGIDSQNVNKNETELSGNAEKIISQNDIFSPELDHCYSSKPSAEELARLEKERLEELNKPEEMIDEDSNSSEEIDVITVDPLCDYNASFHHNLNTPGHEISCLMRDLVIKVERLDVGSYSTSVDKSHESTSKMDIKSIPSNSNNASNKENENLCTSSDNKLAKGSKKRKIKPPIRSPFNFRQRAKIEGSKKAAAKGIKTLNVTHFKTLTHSEDLVIKSLFHKDDIKDEDETDNSMVKIISSIVDSITVEDDVKTDILPHIPSSSQLPKTQRLGSFSNDELTEINTRLNAQIAHQTRRMKVIADSQTSADVSTESLHSTTVSTNSTDSSTNLCSILKKRKASGEVSPKKARKVTFASPLIHELVFDSCSESRAIDAVTMNRIQNLNKKRKKILQEKNKTGKPSSVPVRPPVPVSNESEDIPSSSEYQDSDGLDFSDLPVSPALINCPDDISNILKDLTSQSWVRGLESLLASKNIKTIGDVCRLNIHQVKALPFKSPKVMTLHKALMSYVNSTQESTLQKIKTIDDESCVEMNDATASNSSENSKAEKKEENPEENSSVLLEETIKDILKKDCLKELPQNLLGQLIKACGEAIIEKS